MPGSSAPADAPSGGEVHANLAVEALHADLLPVDPTKLLDETQKGTLI